MKFLSLEVRRFWIEFLVKVCQTFPPFEIFNMMGFSDEIEHGRQALSCLFFNEQVFSNLVTLKLDQCAAWWDKHREEGQRNFDRLCDFIVACANVRELGLSYNDFEEDQIDRVLQAITNSPIANTIVALYLDGNKPKPSMSNSVMALVELAPLIEEFCLVGKHGHTNVRLISIQKQENALVKIFTLN